jgi:hypothetical protein
MGKVDKGRRYEWVNGGIGDWEGIWVGGGAGRDEDRVGEDSI